MANIHLGDDHHDTALPFHGSYESAGIEFSALTNKVKLDFARFNRLLNGRDIEKLIRQKELKGISEDVILTSKLLADITETAPLPSMKAKNLLSGVFLIGLLLGCVLSMFGILILKKGEVEITNTLLTYMGIGFLSALFLVIGVPLLLTALEPYLRKIQEKHHDFVDRLMGLFQ